MISIIIPCKTAHEATDCIRKCFELDCDSFEIIVLPDSGTEITTTFFRVIPTTVPLPSHKRDIGASYARGEVLAFIDSDATPTKNWLRNAKMFLDHTQNIAVCGPGILPIDSPFMEQAADWILQHLPYSYRVRKELPRKVRDYPTFNLIVWKDCFDKVAGFSCDYLTGEDTLLCNKLLRYGDILYTPDVVVYHKRRPLFSPFLRQIAIYARHRGYFFRKGIGERKWVYTFPSLGTFLFLAVGLYLLFLFMVSISH